MLDGKKQSHVCVVLQFCAFQSPFLYFVTVIILTRLHISDSDFYKVK